MKPTNRRPKLTVCDRCAQVGKDSPSRFRVRVPANVSESGKRTDFYFPTKVKAQQFISEQYVNWTLAIRGVDVPAQNLSPEDQELLLAAKRRFGTPEKLYQAADRDERANKVVDPNLTMRQAIELFMEYQNQQDRGPDTLKNDRRYFARIELAIGHRKILEITSGELTQLYLSSSKPSTTRFHYYKALRKLFRWLLATGRVLSNPMEKVICQDKAKAFDHIMPIEDFERILNACYSKEQFLIKFARNKKASLTEFSDLLPYFVLAGFAGIRTREICGKYSGQKSLQWEDIKWGTYIEVLDGVAKKTRARTDKRWPGGELIMDAIEAWLKPFSGTGPVMPFTQETLFERRTELLKALKIKMPQNVLRHSAATYLGAARKSNIIGWGEVSKVLGNQETVAKNIYARPMPNGAGAAWFALRPADPEKIVYIRAQA